MTNMKADRRDMRRAGIGMSRTRGTPRSRMRAFDSLPPEVRMWVANAAFNYDPRQIARNIKAGVPARDIILGIVRADRDMARATAEREGRS